VEWSSSTETYNCFLKTLIWTPASNTVFFAQAAKNGMSGTPATGGEGMSGTP
jgi:hypothetical protein